MDITKKTLTNIPSKLKKATTPNPYLIRGSVKFSKLRLLSPTILFFKNSNDFLNDDFDMDC